MLRETSFDINSIDNLIEELLNGQFEELIGHPDGLSPLLRLKIYDLNVSDKWIKED